MPSPFYPSSVVLFQLHGGMVSHMQVLATHFSTVHNINTWIPALLVLAACSCGSDEAASVTDRHLDIGLQVVEAHPSFPYFLEKRLAIPPSISFFHLLVNGFSVTCLPPFFISK